MLSVNLSKLIFVSYARLFITCNVFDPAFPIITVASVRCFTSADQLRLARSLNLLRGNFVADTCILSVSIERI